LGDLIASRQEEQNRDYARRAAHAWPPVSTVGRDQNPATPRSGMAERTVFKRRHVSGSEGTQHEEDALQP